MTTFKIWFCGALAATAFMMLHDAAKAAPNSIELCNWGKWAWQQNIGLKDLVDTLNSVEGMPYEDKVIVVECFKTAKETM